MQLKYLYRNKIFKMDFLNLLIPKEKIVGIEIASHKLRALALAKDSFGNFSIYGKSEVNLEEGVIDFGAVKDSKKLSEAIAKLKETFKPQKAFSPFAIVTISQNGVYSDILEFPKNLTNEQLIEAISFNAAKISPMPLSESYLDWQIIEKGNNKDKVLISLISKKIANSYINVLKENGFKLIALEPSSFSISRAAEITDDSILFLYLTDEGATSIIYSNRNSYLSQFEFWQEISSGSQIKDLEDLSKVLKIKIASLSRYFENQYRKAKIKKVLLMSEGFDAEQIIKNIEIKDMAVEKAKSGIPSIKNYDWIPVAGAAKRAFIPRSEDTIISLLPIGTESLYEEQKIESFAKSILAIFSVLMIFYTAVFALALFFVSYLGKDIAAQMEKRSNLPMPLEYQKIDSETKEFNNYVSDLSGIYAKTNVDYEALMEKIGSLNFSGITLSNINFGNTAGPIFASGVASSRENLNVFKSGLTNSSYFDNVKFSVQNIAQKSNIPFSINFNLKQF